MKICREIDLEDVAYILRAGAKSRWDDASDSQKEAVWELVNDTFGGNGNIPTESEINDFIWFQCDEIFYPEDDEEESEDEDEYDDE